MDSLKLQRADLLCNCVWRLHATELRGGQGSSADCDVHQKEHQREVSLRTDPFSLSNLLELDVCLESQKTRGSNYGPNNGCWKCTHPLETQPSHISANRDVKEVFCNHFGIWSEGTLSLTYCSSSGWIVVRMSDSINGGIRNFFFESIA